MFNRGLFDHEHAGGGAWIRPSRGRWRAPRPPDSCVLLKNAGDALPLITRTVHSLAVMGPNAAVARTGGGGSAWVAEIRSLPAGGYPRTGGTQFQVG